MHRNKSKLTAIALVAAISLGMPALAKSTHGAKVKNLPSLSTRELKMERVRALNAYGSVRHAPTFGAPNPNHPSLTAGGSIGYNADLYVY